MSEIPKFLPFLLHHGFYFFVGSYIMLPALPFSISLSWYLPCFLSFLELCLFVFSFPYFWPIPITLPLVISHATLIFLLTWSGFSVLVLNHTYGVLFLRFASYLTSCLMSYFALSLASHCLFRLATFALIYLCFTSYHPQFLSTIACDLSALRSDKN